jgi:hypothetical protein
MALDWYNEKVCTNDWQVCTSFDLSASGNSKSPADVIKRQHIGLEAAHFVSWMGKAFWGRRGIIFV